MLIATSALLFRNWHATIHQSKTFDFSQVDTLQAIHLYPSAEPVLTWKYGSGRS
ncbi:hypothetical protein LMG23994_07202 [Cupriavidus pinatubonensis]|uniref:Uncharacterized protein n=1 Tax=Cupriavidus pinatubonensis TaxID=248026 RepID=A0ABM8Y4P6_9BURK|nr:hypothetical protein LMG23994_07202 [Cupriavidus pinatubonensis]